MWYVNRCDSDQKEVEFEIEEGKNFYNKENIISSIVHVFQIKFICLNFWDKAW